MPTSEVNITFDTRTFPNHGVIAGAYRLALQRDPGQIGIFNLPCKEYDEYDAAAMAVALAYNEVHKYMLDHHANQPGVTYNITVHSEYGHGLWSTLMEKKPKAYEYLYTTMYNPDTPVRLGLTRPGNNPLRNHTYVAAIKGLTDVDIPASLADTNPQQWFTLQKVFTEAYGPITPLGTPAIDSLRNNAIELDRIREETPDVHCVLSKAIEHLDTRTAEQNVGVV